MTFSVQVPEVTNVPLTGGEINAIYLSLDLTENNRAEYYITPNDPIPDEPKLLVWKNIDLTA